MYKFLIIALGIFFFLSCKKGGESPTPDYGQDYFVYTDSMQQEYKITYSEYNIFGKEVTESYLKEVYVDFPETPRTDDFKIYVYKKSNLETDYQLDSVMSGIYNSEEYLRNEHNIIKTKLAFPLNASKSWDVNAYNTQDTLFTEMVWYDEAYTLNANQIEKTLRTETKNQQTFISDELSYEIYGRELGLLTKEIRDLGFQPGQDTIGYIYTKTRINLP